MGGAPQPHGAARDGSIARYLGSGKEDHRMDVELRFSDGPAIEAHYKGHVVSTDQPVAKGGRGAAPSPFDLFVVSLATCAGFYVSTFLRQRGLPTEGLGLRLTP